MVTGNVAVAETGTGKEAVRVIGGGPAPRTDTVGAETPGAAGVGVEVERAETSPEKDGGVGLGATGDLTDGPETVHVKDV